MNFNETILLEIKKHAKNNPRIECCGYIKNDKVFECQNLSPFPEQHFLIDPCIIIEYSPDCIYHSHVNCSCKPSKFDVLNFREINIPFLIYSLIDDDFYLLDKMV